MKKEILDAYEGLHKVAFDLSQMLQEFIDATDITLERDLWRECADKLYEELRVRGVHTTATRDGKGCIEIFENLRAVFEPRSIKDNLPYL